MIKIDMTMSEIIKILVDPYKEWVGDESETYSKWAFAVLGLGILCSCLII